MITVVLQMLVFLCVLIFFAWLALKIDRNEDDRGDARQRSIYFPEHKEREKEHEHRGAAMSRL